MSDFDPTRAMVWIDSAAHTVAAIRTTLDAVLAAGFAADQVRVVVDSDALENPEELAAAAGERSVQTVGADAASLNEALEATRADYLFVIRWGRIASTAAATLIGFLDRNAMFDLAYGDSVGSTGLPILRPVASPVRLLGNDYLGPVVVLRTTAIRAIGGFRSNARRAQVLDIALRLVEDGRGPVLVPAVLAVEDLAEEDFAETSGAQKRVVADALERRGIRAEVVETAPFLRRLNHQLAHEPLVSIVIPTRGGSVEIAGRERVLVVEAIRGILARSSYRNVEFVVVADAETPTSVIEELEEIAGDRLRLVLWDAPFNFSAKMNRGAVVATGEYLLLLNDDVEIVTDDWIESLLGPAQLDGVGMVGALLYFEDSTIQHAGQIYTDGVAGHAAFGWNGGRDDSIRSLNVDHEVSGVTAACALIRRDLYFEVGGFTLELPGNYNDVDLNMKVRATGRSSVLSPHARLYHFESKSRDPKILPSDLTTLQSRWKRRMQVELYSRML